MGTLASELGVHAGRIAGQPRVYVDANVPAGLVAFMRTDLRWDVLFVIEHEDLRRERDGRHFRLARELGRTLITLDRDYLEDRLFPMQESGGVLVLSAPGEKEYRTLLTRLDSAIFRTERPDRPLPLLARKLHIHVDWRDETSNGDRSLRPRAKPWSGRRP